MSVVEHRQSAPRKAGVTEWARTNLFSTWYYGLLSVFLGVAIVAVVGAIVLRFGQSDFTILRTNLTLLMVGTYPRGELWRVATALIGMGFVSGVAAGYNSKRSRVAAEEAGLPFHAASPTEVVRRLWPALVVVVAVLALTTTITPTLLVLASVLAVAVGRFVGKILPVHPALWVWLGMAIVFVGVYLVLAAVPWDNWGGFLVNIFLTVAGIALAFPFGLVLALGRRSSLPAFKVASITYIEFIRGVPLISLLLLGIFAIGFFLPANVSSLGRVTRVLIGIVLFESAYVAEVVRGGLQAVPKGQVEAGQALGLSPWANTRRIVLPQALRATIPAMVGQFISLYKDTTLALIVGVSELLNVAQVINSQPEFFGQGLHLVTLPFAGLLFWTGCYMMSREARRLEKRLGIGER